MTNELGNSEKLHPATGEVPPTFATEGTEKAVCDNCGRQPAGENGLLCKNCINQPDVFGWYGNELKGKPYAKDLDDFLERLIAGK